MRRPTIALLLAVFLVSVVAGTSLAGHYLYNSSGNKKHWSDNDPGFPRGYVYWHDKTGSAMPVYASAIEWDKETRLDAVYVSGGSSCTSSHCVTVYELDYSNVGCSNPYGEAYTPTNTAGHLTTDTWVRFDRQCGSRTYADRRELVCHELGHSIGLQHLSSSANTCMRQGDMAGYSLPNQHDYDLLHALYNHDH